MDWTWILCAGQKSRARGATLVAEAARILCVATMNFRRAAWPKDEAAAIACVAVEEGPGCVLDVAILPELKRGISADQG